MQTPPILRCHALLRQAVTIITTIRDVEPPPACSTQPPPDEAKTLGASGVGLNALWNDPFPPTFAVATEFRGGVRGISPHPRRRPLLVRVASLGVQTSKQATSRTWEVASYVSVVFMLRVSILIVPQRQ